MEISGINCNRELIVIMTLEDMNKYLEYVKNEADNAYNQGWADAGLNNEE